MTKGDTSTEHVPIGWFSESGDGERERARERGGEGGGREAEMETIRERERVGEREGGRERGREDNRLKEGKREREYENEKRTDKEMTTWILKLIFDFSNPPPPPLLAEYRVEKKHGMPDLYRSFSTKEPHT